MLRFCGKGLLKQGGGITIIVADQQLVFSEEIWHDGRDYFKCNICYDITKLQVIPVLNASGEIICYGWQDNEANRELRMLRELESNPDARQFNDVFPEIKEVLICGCNELAYCFAKYLEHLRISVYVKGKYWNYFGYECIEDSDFDDSDIMIIRAEHILENNSSLFQRVVRSASPEFECINRVYEENILVGNMKNTEGDFSNLLKTLERNDVILLGRDEKAQDTYDLLLTQGIDIKCFAVEKTQGNGPVQLLGKRVEAIETLLRDENNSLFVEVHSKNSVWGNKYVELFDYYGYERNKKFFFINDYTDIPFSNLIHVLKGKKVVLAGDERLCRILTEYLMEMEQGDIGLRYIKMVQNGMVKETDILCVVCLWHGSGALVKKEQILGGYLDSEAYTDYFSRASVFVNIDQYRIGLANKYNVKQLIPKGVLLNITFFNSGNIFFRGLVDGHPNILSMQFNTFLYNLFGYCIRLSMERAEDIQFIFQSMLKDELSEAEFKDSFPHWSRFCNSLKERLTLQERFTSQELFVIFHIAYAEMMGSEKLSELTQKVIYFDPHGFLVTERVFLAKWLESDAINGQVVTIHRDDVANACSFYTRSVIKDEKMKLARDIIGWMLCEKKDLGMGQVDFQYCRRFEVRFEDLKLHPRAELAKICERMQIPWCDSLMHTTYLGKTSAMGTIRDFDIKPIFNRHEANWSELDRFRLYLLCSSYQKSYGYPYEDCTQFSRTQLWELFLKEFRFQKQLLFENEEDKAAYYLWTYELIRWQLHKNRWHAVMDDIRPKFKPIEIGKTEDELRTEIREIIRKEKCNLAEFIRSRKKLVLYGLGRDGKALWDCLDESIRLGIVLCDKKAEADVIHFHGRQVVSPKELCEKYKDYEILVTSSRYYREISAELDDMGISADRITCNTVQLWEKDDD